MMSEKSRNEIYHRHSKNVILRFLESTEDGKFEYVSKFWSFQVGAYVYAFKQKGDKGLILYLAYWKNLREPKLYDQISIRNCNVEEELRGKIWL